VQQNTDIFLTTGMKWGGRKTTFVMQM